MFLKSKVRSCKSAVLAALAVTCGLSLLIPRSGSLAQSPLPDRIAEVIDDSQVVVLKGNVSPLAEARYDQGEVEGGFKLHGITMMFKLTESQQADLNTLLQQQHDRHSPEYHYWLTPEQYANRFGLTVADINKIIEWLQVQGFPIDQTARSRTWIAFSGTAAQVEAAFHTEIHRYVMNGETHYANATQPSVPAALAGVVLGLRSLNDFRPTPGHPIRKTIRGSAKPDFTDGRGDFFLSPADFATIYDVSSLYNAGLNGAGVTIAIVGQSDVNLADIEAFRRASSLPSNDPKVVLVPGSRDPGSNDAEGEADLDLEWSGAVAPNASIIYVNSTNAVGSSLPYAIDQNLARVASASFHACEPQVGATEAASFQALGQQANAQGMTILSSAGDEGPASCDNKGAAVATMGLAVGLPASLPGVTGVGGTEFNEGSGSFWSSGGSALSYIPEIAWNDTASTHGLSASGGGASIFFAKPTWQTGAGVPNDGARDVPDLSLNASPNHDPYLICMGGSCVNGFVSSSGSFFVAGGTSASTPSFAGIVALIDQATGSAQGNINPILYELAASPGIFHDITAGNNKVPCQAGSPNCPSSGEFGFNAGPGYDQATGLGSVDAAKLVAAFQSIAPSYTLGISAGSLTITYGTSGTATVSITAVNGFKGTVQLTCSVASSLGSTSCKVSPSSITSSGSTTLTVTAPVASATVPGPAGFGGLRWWPGMGLILACGLFSLLSRRLPADGLRPLQGVGNWARYTLLFALLLGCVMVSTASCGGGGSSNNSSGPPPPIVLTGDVTVQAVSGSLSASVQLPVTVN